MKQIVLKGKQYKDIMKGMKAAVSKEDCRPCLKGVYLEVEETTARFTALDGYQLAHVVISHIGESAAEPWSVIMPAIDIKAKSDDWINITVETDQVSIKNQASDETVSQRIIAGEYVKYRSFITGFSEVAAICVDVRKLKRALEGANLCDAHTVRLTYDHNNRCAPLILKGFNSSDRVHFTSMVLPIKPSTVIRDDEHII